MSYCRFNGGLDGEERSDAYIIGTVYGRLECMACRLLPRDGWFDTFSTTSRTEMLRHMQEHRQKKSKVPYRASRRLKREIKELGDEVRKGR